MKFKHILSAVFLASACVVQAATNDLTALLQKGLFEEEANHNLEAAMQAYQSAISQHDKDRKLVATAVFRLGECLRKQGKTNEANAQYERVVREFSDQSRLVASSQEYLGRGTGTVQADSNEIGKAAAPSESTLSATSDEEEEIRKIKAMIQNSPDLINAPASGETPLQIAASKDYLTVAQFLLANGAEVNATDSSARTPLYLAASTGHKAMAELLLANHADIQHPDGNKSTPLHVAAAKGFKTVVELLLAHKADPNAMDKQGGTPLHDAANNGNVAIAQLLLASKADVNAKDDIGESPLHKAAATGNKEMVQLLLANKADVNARSSSGRTPLLKTGDLEVCKLLVAGGADVEARITGPCRNGYRALELAIDNDNAELVELLLNSHVDPNAPFIFRKSPYITIKPDNYKDTNLGMPNLGVPFLGYHPLQLAVDNSNQNDHIKMLKIIESLLSHGANPNLADEAGRTALVSAAASKQEEVVKLLLDHKANVEMSVNGLTPLGAAVKSDDLKMVELLCSAGADVNKPFINSNFKETALHRAVIQGNDKIVALLLAHKANVNALDGDGFAPISYAKTIEGHNANQAAMHEIVELLRKAGANENYERLPRIAIEAQGTGQVPFVFLNGTNSLNRYTLLELIATAYGENKGVPFEDFTNIKIDRVNTNGTTSKMSVNLSAILQAADPSKDIWLEWGDIVEIPQIDHRVTDNWPGLPAEMVNSLKKCLRREVSIVVKGQTTKITLLPGWVGSAPPPPGIPLRRRILPPTSPAVQAPKEEQAGVNLETFNLYDVVRQSNVLLASSDLARVKVKRIDPVTQKPREIILDLTSPPKPDLWLRDGDVIEIPERDQSVPAPRS